jgi:hypothetical protein
MASRHFSRRRDGRKPLMLTSVPTKELRKKSVKACQPTFLAKGGVRLTSGQENSADPKADGTNRVKGMIGPRGREMSAAACAHQSSSGQPFKFPREVHPMARACWTMRRPTRRDRNARCRNRCITKLRRSGEPVSKAAVVERRTPTRPRWCAHRRPDSANEVMVSPTMM